MSILKFANGKNRGTNALEDGLKYVLNPEKASSEYIACNGVDRAFAAEDMKTIQRLLGKDAGRRYIHYILSFDAGVSLQKAFSVASESAEYFADDYQYVLAMHTNTANIHAHVILNAVSVHTGKKFSQSKAEMLDFRNFVNTILLAYGLKAIGEAGEKPGVYSDLYFDCEDNFFDTEEDDDCMATDSFFGLSDPEELEQIRLAESYEAEKRQIIAFFEGEEPNLPQGWCYEDALDAYAQWEEYVKCMEKREDESHGFFEKHA